MPHRIVYFVTRLRGQAAIIRETVELLDYLITSIFHVFPLIERDITIFEGTRHRSNWLNLHRLARTVNYLLNGGYGSLVEVELGI